MNLKETWLGPGLVEAQKSEKREKIPDAMAVELKEALRYTQGVERTRGATG